MPFLPYRESGSIVCFIDRHQAGEKLAQAVLHIVSQQPELETANFVVYALPKGGLPIAEPIARALNCPLDVIVAKKITRPDNVELAIGAVTADGHVVWDSHRRELYATASPETSQATDLSFSTLYAVALQEAQIHAQAQLAALSPDHPRFSPHGAIALLVDDGIATGMTMMAAVQAVRSQQPAQVWLCTPVSPGELMPLLHAYGDRVIVLATPHPFYSVSRFYKSFPQVTLAEAVAYLR
ncbi:MAG: phosphoribosyltransferase [Lyngbya sp. HA4199-MV5]|jgi:predicted phosphoribosyltransferase|nr:phosphoribosyltransferase [Lyngbya sp. HA4199-MV5]